MSGRPVRSGFHADPRASDVRVQLPLLDRLLDDAPHEKQHDPPLAPGQAHVVLQDAVRRDLEALLNARQPWRSLPPGYAALRRSPLGYGLPDFAAGAFNAAERREQLRAEVKAVIDIFEKRLTQVRVGLLDAGRTDATLRLQINAQLEAEPAPEPVGFETLMHATTSDVEVRQSRDV
jgi:type VI secretion system protein ImpF